jgi:hypothetical protein
MSSSSGSAIQDEFRLPFGCTQHARQTVEDRPSLDLRFRLTMAPRLWRIRDPEVLLSWQSYCGSGRRKLPQ